MAHNDSNSERTLTEGAQSHRRRGRGRKTFWVILAAAAAFIVLAAGSSIGQSGDTRRRGGEAHATHPWGSIEEIQRQLAEGSFRLDGFDLSETQRAEISDLLERLAPEMGRLSQGRDALEARVAEALGSGATDPARYEEIRRTAHELTRQGVDTAFDAVFGVAQILTPEQRRELLGHWREHAADGRYDH